MGVFAQQSAGGDRRSAPLLSIGLVATALALIAAFTLLRDGAQPIDLAAGATISCSANSVTYGEPTACETSASVPAEIHWGDGHVGDLNHVVDGVGAVPIQLVSDSGIVLAATTVDIAPDLEISCEVDEWKNIYKFSASDETETGWDYVYENPSTGERIGPGHVDHPADPGLTDLAVVVVGRVQETGMCTATSAAAEAHDGAFTFTMGSAWEEHSVPFARLEPWSDHHWKGTQPGFIDVAVTVNDATVSERRDIYLSGCT